MQFFRRDNHKYAILLIFHSIDLFLKELLSRQHPILIYRNIDKKITTDSQTVGLAESLSRFRNVGVSLTKDEEQTLRSLQRRRNQIEHHRYDLDHADSDTLGRSLRFVIGFVTTHLDDSLANHINDDLLRDIERVVLSYEERNGIATHELEKWAATAYEDGIESEDFVGTVDCPVCYQSFLVLAEPTKGDYCFFCRDEIYALECDHCGRTFLPDGELTTTCSDCLSYEE